MSRDGKIPHPSIIYPPQFGFARFALLSLQMMADICGLFSLTLSEGTLKGA